eukprot:m.181576 g.181576  ORF g.181576 m.181576 type:complete len:470 (+) comp15515_c0_seq4:565-1974(+)
MDNNSLVSKSLTKEHVDKLLMISERRNHNLVRVTWVIWKAQMRKRQDRMKADFENEQRKIKMALAFCNSKILANSFRAWLTQTLISKRNTLEVEKQRSRTENMAILLEQLQSSIADAKKPVVNSIEDPVKIQKKRESPSPQRHEDDDILDEIIILKNPKIDTSGNGQNRDAHGTDLSKTIPALSKLKSNTSGGSSDNEKQASQANSLLKGMAERATRREAMKAARIQRQKEKEAKLKVQEEIEHKRIQASLEAAKRERVREQKLKKKKDEERRAEIKKKRDVAKLKHDLAESHYDRKCVLKAWKRWVQLVNDKRVRIQRIQKHVEVFLLRQTFRAWRLETEHLSLERNKRCEVFRARILTLHCFKAWNKVRLIRQADLSLAQRTYDRHLKKRCIQAWIVFKESEFKRFLVLNRDARKLQKRYLCETYFVAWKKYVSLAQEEVKRKELKNKLRALVLEIVPDYKHTDEEF